MASDELRVGRIAAVVAIVTAILTAAVTYFTTNMQVSEAKRDTRDQIRSAIAVTLEQGKLTRKQAQTNYENAKKENSRQFKVSQRSSTYTLLFAEVETFKSNVNQSTFIQLLGGPAGILQIDPSHFAFPVLSPNKVLAIDLQFTSFQRPLLSTIDRAQSVVACDSRDDLGHMRDALGNAQDALDALLQTAKRGRYAAYQRDVDRFEADFGVIESDYDSVRDDARIELTGTPDESC